MKTKRNPVAKKRKEIINDVSGSSEAQGNFDEAGLGSLLCRMGPDPQKNIDEIVRYAFQMVRGDFVAYCRLDDRNASMIVDSAWNLPDDFPTRRDPDGLLCYELTVKGDGQPSVLSDLAQHPLAENNPIVKKYGLKAYLGAPVSFRGKHIGSLGIGASSQTKFTENEIRIVSILSKLISLEENRRQGEASLSHRLELEKMLNLISTRAIRITDMQDFLDNSLAIMGQTLDVEGAFIWEYDEKSHTVSNISEWMAEGMSSQIDNLQSIPADLFSWSMKLLIDGQVVRCSHVDELPNGLEKETLKQMGVQSLLGVPLFIGESFYGFIVFEEYKRNRFWQDEDVDLLRTISRVISEAIAGHRLETALRESETRYREIVEHAPAGIYEIDFKSNRFLDANDYSLEWTGYSRQEFLSMPASRLLTKKSNALYRERLAAIRSGKPVPDTVDYEVRCKDGSTRWCKLHVNFIQKGDRKVGARVIAHDITARKMAEQELTMNQERLEHLVDERTAELTRANRTLSKEVDERKHMETALRDSERQLKVETARLEETNAALQVLLKKRDDDRNELQEKVLINIKELVEPYLRKMKETDLDERQNAYMEVIASNLSEITCPLIPRLSQKYLKFTPAEIHVVNLLKQGRPTKEIAKLMGLSPRTVETHRNNIRRKIGISNRKINLRTYLQSIQ